MTVHDMVVTELKRLGADGLINRNNPCRCMGTMTCANRGIFDNTLCVPAKLVNGELVPMEEK
jgi:hypothetical protein